MIIFHLFFKAHVFVSVFQVPAGTMCTPTPTQQRRRTSPPQTPPGWTAGCSLKSKYVGGSTHDDDNNDNNVTLQRKHSNLIENVLGVDFKFLLVSVYFQCAASLH